jgi:hypothetical protein
MIALAGKIPDLAGFSWRTAEDGFMEIRFNE